MQPRLLAVVAHPDDESWALGALIAHVADRGDRVAVLALTGSPTRLDELEAACRELGAIALPSPRLPDGGLDTLSPDTVAAHVADAVRRERPTVVSTLDLDGGYGHRDHIATTRAALLATRDLPATRVLLRCFAPDILAPVRRSLLRSPWAHVIADPAAPLGVAPRPDEERIAVAPARERIARALAAHRSQLGGRAPLDLLGNGRIEAAWAADDHHERYRVVRPQPARVAPES